MTSRVPAPASPKMRLVVLLALAGLWGCHKAAAPAAADASCACAPAPPLPKEASSLKPARREPTAARPQVAPLPICKAGDRLPLDAARAAYDAQAFEEALSCAAQAAALTPGDVLAHAERANALVALERFDEAALGYARALAVDPDSLDALLGAARLFAVVLPSTREHDELGSLYAEHGLELARTQHDEELAAHFARISAMAFNDLGQSQDAIDRAAYTLSVLRDDADARFERAVGLFELLRFPEARDEFKRLLGDAEHAPHALHHLGLIAEREGHPEEAQADFARARGLDPEDFPAPVLLSPEEFRQALAAAVASLPLDMRRDLDGVPVGAEDLPSTDDLTANSPPLSPTILGLFRGPPLKEACEPEPGARPGAPCRSVVLYRKNLGRAVKTKDELLEQIRTTLLHEVGHLRGEDDYELAARGLE